MAKIDFSSYEFDVLNDGLDKILSYLKTSTVLSGIIQIELEQVEEAYQDTLNILQSRTVDDAIGVQLDILGILVGQKRNGLNDDDYRIQIKGRIFRNHVKYGSVAEILQFVILVFGINISIQNEGLQDISLIVPDGTDADTILTLVSEINNSDSNHQFFLPLICGTRIFSVLIVPDDPFILDINSIDTNGMAVAYPVI